MPRCPGLGLLALALSVAEGSAVASRNGFAGGRAALRGGGAGVAKASPHYWPHARGRAPLYSAAAYRGPADLNASLAWTWSHPKGTYGTVVIGGPLIDSEKNIYLATADGVRKFSPEGEVLWHYDPPGNAMGCPSLMGDALYGSTADGHLYAISLESGEELWSREHADMVWPGHSFVEAHDGVVLAGMKKFPLGGNAEIIAVSAETGKMLWKRRTAAPLHTVMPLFPDDDTTVVMDVQGGLSRLGLHNGTQLWHKAPPGPFLQISVTEGGAALGPDGSVYTCSNPPRSKGHLQTDDHGGVVRKFRLSDGAKLWEQVTAYPCGSFPAVSQDGGLVVVPIGGALENPLQSEADTSAKAMVLGKVFGDELVPIAERSINLGQRQRADAGLPDLPGAVLALDAQTGKPRWQHEVAPWGRVMGAGEEEGLSMRAMEVQHPRLWCMGPHWTAPSISRDGTVYVGRSSGDLYALSAGGGLAAFHTGNTAPPAGASFAPGIMAYADCTTLYVFRTPAA